MSVLFLPKWNEANPYQNLLAGAIERRGVQVCMRNYSPGILSIIPALLGCDTKIRIIHLHWISPVAMKICWPKSDLAFYIKCLIFIFEICLCRLSGKKIVWTIHNRVSHESKNRQREIILRKCLAKTVNTIILHSTPAKKAIEQEYEIALAKKTKIIPHGNYQGCYPAPSKSREELKKDRGFSEDTTIVLYFGAIKPYKGVEKIISAANQLEGDAYLQFIIAGEAIDPGYRRQLLDSGNQQNLSFDLQFLSDQLLVDYIESADLILLPFNNTLTSGSVILSMTLGKGLILSSEAQVFGCIEEGGAFYFNDQTELVSLLKNLDESMIRQSSVINYKTAKQLDWDYVADLTLSAYGIKPKT